MRLPYSVTDSETGQQVVVQDTQMIEQLAHSLNEMNNHDPSLAIEFIPWVPSKLDISDRLSKAESKGNSMLVDQTVISHSNIGAVQRARQAVAEVKGLNNTKVKEFANNIFVAHQKSLLAGHFNYSSYSYLVNVLGADFNVADLAGQSSNDWPLWESEDVYLLASEWRTIDKGMQRLTDAFKPLVLNRTKLNFEVGEVQHDKQTDKLNLMPPSDAGNSSDNMQVDYLFNSVPFNLVRFWDLPPHSSRLRRAINRMRYSGSVKMILHFRTRFWENLKYPILGGCLSSDNPMFGELCYPSYNINGSGPGVLLSYVASDDARALCALSEKQHVNRILAYLKSLHGPVVYKQFTGLYHRHCWDHEPYSGGAWSAPSTSQQPLYLPAYFRTEQNTVYIGEHTSITHSYIFSALESAVRGTVQMLVDVGLTMEAKQITETWMERWMD